MYLATYTALNGSKRTEIIKAEFREEIYEIPGLQGLVSSVYKVPDFIGRILERKLDLPDQLLLVAQISTLVQSGADIEAGLKKIIKGTPSLSYFQHDPRISHVSKVSDYLKLFGAGESTILLTVSGEETGQLVETLATAVDNIDQEMELEKVMGAEMAVGITYILAGTVTLLAVSLMLGGAAEDTIVNSEYLTANGATKLIVALRHLQLDHTAILVTGVGAAIYATFWAWEHSPFFKKLPGVRALDALIKSKRSARFLNAWTPLFKAGYSPDDSLILISNNYSGESKRAVESILDGIDQGGTLPTSLDERYWSPSLIVGLGSFDDVHDKARINLLGSLKNLLLREIFVSGKKFSRIAFLIGVLSAATTIMIIASGFYGPIMMGRGG